MAGMEVLVILIGRMKDRFKPHISSGTVYTLHVYMST